MTHDMEHVTHYTWGGGLNILSKCQVPSSYGLTCFEDIKCLKTVLFLSLSVFKVVVYNMEDGL